MGISDIFEYFDSDVIYNPMYWLLTAGAIIAVILGFSTQTLWGTDVGMPLYSKILTIVLIPIVSYMIVLKFSS